MAKKADLLAEAAKLNLEVSEKNTIAQIEEAIAGAAVTEAVAEEIGRASCRDRVSRLV